MKAAYIGKVTTILAMKLRETDITLTHIDKVIAMFAIQLL